MCLAPWFKGNAMKKHMLQATILAFLVLCTCGCKVIEPIFGSSSRGARIRVKCVKINSPTNVIVSYKDERLSISFLGITTPPAEDDMYRPTIAFLKMLKNKNITIETFEPVNEGFARALVFCEAQHIRTYEYGDSHTFPVHMNAELVRKGYAKVDLGRLPSEYTNIFLNYQRQAKEERRGIWKNP